ncbi:hypothetical protein ACFWXO_30960 [Kitasatospora sp. NPDC059088]|uniref:hypothetical protein n=1 Tax=Kitasatospora sp. NPDC059088 TaxID=3346722 RepID=UPI003695E0CF
MTPTSRPRTPWPVAALINHARRYGWHGEVGWEPAGLTNLGPQFIVELTGEPVRGSGRLRLVWTDRGQGYHYQPWFATGTVPGGRGVCAPLERREAEATIRNNPVHPCAAATVDEPRDWRAADVAPPMVDELTEAMLAPVRRAAALSRLPQTVWASRFVGRHFVGEDCLLTSAAPGRQRPSDAHPDGEPMLTVLPPL